jgi:hypothetical protein
MHSLGINATITWRSSTRSSAAYFHTDVPFYTDAIVKEHTKMVLADMLDNLNAEFNDIFRTGQTGLAFLVSRPLMRRIGRGTAIMNSLHEFQHIDTNIFTQINTPNFQII